MLASWSIGSRPELRYPCTLYLNAMGVGTLGIVEQDIIESHQPNKRQVLLFGKGFGKVENRRLYWSD